MSGKAPAVIVAAVLLVIAKSDDIWRFIARYAPDYNDLTNISYKAPDILPRPDLTGRLDIPAEPPAPKDLQVPRAINWPENGSMMISTVGINPQHFDFSLNLGIYGNLANKPYSFHNPALGSAINRNLLSMIEPGSEVSRPWAHQLLRLGGTRSRTNPPWQEISNLEFLEDIPCPLETDASSDSAQSEELSSTDYCSQDYLARYYELKHGRDIQK